MHWPPIIFFSLLFFFPRKGSHIPNWPLTHLVANDDLELLILLLSALECWDFEHLGLHAWWVFKVILIVPNPV